MKLIRPLATAAALGVAAATLAACGPSPEADGPTELRLGVGAAQLAFNPAFIGSGIDANWHISAVYDSLLVATSGIGIGPEGLEPRAATGWEYSEGNTLLTVTLRDDILFTDGSPLDAEAVKANLEAVLSEETGYYDRPYFTKIDEVTVTDDFELEIHLARPDAQFLSVLGALPLVNPVGLEDPDALAAEPAGSGPYLLDDFTTDVEYSFVRNPDYWGSEEYVYDRIEIILLEDGTARLNALKSGQIDVTGIDAATVGEIEASGFDTTVTSSVWAGLVFGDRRGEISEPIGNLKVRQAISTAFDRVGFAEAFDGGLGDPSNQVGIEGQGGFYLPERADQYAYDLEAARELLAEAGYPDGFDIDVPYWPVLAERYRPYYDQTFQDLGIRVNWVLLTDDNAIAELSSGKYAMFPFLALTFDFAMYEADGLWNPWRNTDAESEEALSAIHTGTAEESAAGIAALNELILDDVWFAVLAHLPSVMAYPADLELTTNGYGIVPLQTIRPAD